MEWEQNMNIESMISGLNNDEMLEALELIWTKLSSDSARVVSPEWHERIINDRLANPSGASLPLAESKSQVMERLNERRTQS